MHIILGATGNIGKHVLTQLRDSHSPVLAITHSQKNCTRLRELNVEVALVEIRDAESLAKVFQKGQSAFILNPPGDIAGDSVQDEIETVQSILKALKTSNLHKLVVESTQGAQPGRGIGDFGVLYQLEQGIREIGIPASITRAGYYMSNWDLQLESAKKGEIISFFPKDFKLPMVAPRDIGQYSAQKLRSNIPQFEIVDFTGPEEYSPQDVADAFSLTLKRDVSVREIPRSRWVETFRQMGFSEISANSYSKMTAITLAMNERPAHPVQGATTLQSYIDSLVHCAIQSERNAV